MDEHAEQTRRRLLQLGLALPLPLLAACGRGDESGTVTAAATEEGTTTLAPTPACDDGDEPTPEQTEGPFFTPDSPERRSLLEAGIEGTPLLGRAEDHLLEPKPARRLRREEPLDLEHHRVPAFNA